jgi:hypothetical protein
VFSRAPANADPDWHWLPETGETLHRRPHALGVRVAAETGKEIVPQKSRFDLRAESLSEHGGMGAMLVRWAARFTRGMAEGQSELPRRRNGRRAVPTDTEGHRRIAVESDDAVRQTFQPHRRISFGI